MLVNLIKTLEVLSPFLIHWARQSLLQFLQTVIRQKKLQNAGADFVGMEDLAEQFKKEEISVDVVISTQAAMKVVGQLGQILGPKGLMPNPKTGTVTEKSWRCY